MPAAKSRDSSLRTGHAARPVGEAVAEHTPGPWTPIPKMDSRGDFPIIAIDGRGIAGATLLDTIYAGYGDQQDKISRTPEGQREGWANACLAAAAPALLEALEGLFVGGFIDAGTREDSQWAYELKRRLEVCRAALAAAQPPASPETPI